MSSFFVFNYFNQPSQYTSLFLYIIKIIVLLYGTIIQNSRVTFVYNVNCFVRYFMVQYAQQ